ncbi:MAG TPA: hypothetical protein VMP03_16445, partial [Methylomirabilota bacterium]|nr:hypothetical protein [Methylomirabilota bacterium]
GQPAAVHHTHLCDVIYLTIFSRRSSCWSVSVGRNVSLQVDVPQAAHIQGGLWKGADVTNFVLRTEDEEDLGFLLFAKHDGEWPPAGENKCVFNGSPFALSLFDDPRSRFIMEHKGREWIADVHYTDMEMTVRINLSTGWTFELRSNEDGNIWTAVREDETICGVGLLL